MLDGHFVWIWVDTAETKVNNKNVTDDGFKERSDVDADSRRRRSAAPSAIEKLRYFIRESDISDMHINYLLKNDQYLLFNNQNGVESSKFKNRNDYISADKSDFKRQMGAEGAAAPPELPTGLLSLRPLPIRVDRHLVKGAVRLLVSTLRQVLSQSPDSLFEGIVAEKLSSSCWYPLGVQELNFSNTYAR